jgi:hypothetical protein
MCTRGTKWAQSLVPFFFATLLLVALANDRHGKPKALHELVGISVDSTKLPFADFAGKVHLNLAKSQSY